MEILKSSNMNLLGDMLILAAEYDFEDIFKVLIEKEAVDINYQDKYGNTALATAISNNSQKVLRLYNRIEHLTMFDGTISILDIEENKVAIKNFDLVVDMLMIAAKYDHLKAVKVLIEKKIVNVYQMDKYGQTALTVACENNSKETVRFLWDKGAGYILQKSGGIIPTEFKVVKGLGTVLKLSANGQTALKIACENGFLTVVKIIVRSVLGYLDHIRFATPFGKLVKNNRLVQLVMAKIGFQKMSLRSYQTSFTSDLIRTIKGDLKLSPIALYSIGNKNEQIGIISWTPLMTVAKFNLSGLVTLLIKNGVMVNQVNQYGTTALMTAAHYNSKEVANELIKAGANVNQQDYQGMSALIIAAGHNFTKFANLLIKAGAQIGLKDYCGNTAMTWASAYNLKKMVKLLIKADAELSNENIHDDMALMSAVEYDHEEITKLLKVASVGNSLQGSKMDETCLIRAARYDSIKVFRMIVDDGAQIQFKTEDGKTLLMKAALHDSGDIADFLIDAGVFIDDVDKYGNTALMIAAQYDSDEVANKLIIAGAQIDRQNANKDDALMIASTYNSIYVATLLIEAGAKIDVEKKLRITILMHQAEYNCEKVVNIFINAGLTIDQVTKYGVIALVRGLKFYSLEELTSLVHAGGEIDDKRDEKYTFLQVTTINNLE